jgi:recombination protein RecR
VYPQPLRALIDELGRLPGIGPKSAQRLAFYLLRQPDEDARRLANALVAMREQTSLCSICCNVADRSGRCDTCADPRRDQTIICVVEDPRDVVAVERSGAFRGTYHVLHGALSPLEGVGPDQLHVAELTARVAAGGIVEVILCTNPNVEGDATAMYLSRVLAPLGVSVTRPASGLPVGGDLEFADDATLGRALDGRRPVEA